VRGATSWLTAAARAVRRLPHQVHWEREEDRIQRRAAAFIEELNATATWRCELHGDAWRRRDGRFIRVMPGTWPLFLPMSRVDAEDFHGYRRGPR
jgi:hypothetical protein